MLDWYLCFVPACFPDFPKRQAARLEAFKHRPTDVLVNTVGKAGTTWVMQITQQLRMGGVEIDYDDQHDIMPFWEGVPWLDTELEEVEQPGAFRIFKSHLPWKDHALNGVPADMKTIYVCRDVCDQLLSLWKYWCPLVELDIPIWAMASYFVVSGEVDKHLNDLCDFWEHRNDGNVCLMFFDDLKENHFKSVQRIQQFVGAAGGKELTQKVVEQSTHEYMSQPELSHKFDDHKFFYALDERRGITRTWLLTGKVRKGGGKSGAGRQQLPRAVVDWVDFRWRSIVLPRTGFQNMKEMRAAMAAELN